MNWNQNTATQPRAIQSVCEGFRRSCYLFFWEAVSGHRLLQKAVPVKKKTSLGLWHQSFFISYVLHNIKFDSLTSLMYNITLDRTLWGLRSGLYIYSYGIRRYINAANIRILYSVLDSLNDFNSHRPVISIAADLFCMIQSLYFWTTDLYGKNKMHLNKRDENEHFLLPGLNLIFNSNQLNNTINEVLINYWELQVLVTFILHLLKFPLLTTERQCKHCTHDIKATGYTFYIQ